jgi:hypothetical protein
MGFTIDMKAHVVCDDYKFDRPSHSRMAELRDRIPRTLHHGLPEGLNLHHGLQPHTCSSAKLNRENSLYYTVKLTYTSKKKKTSDFTPLKKKNFRLHYLTLSSNFISYMTLPLVLKANIVNLHTK